MFLLYTHTFTRNLVLHSDQAQEREKSYETIITDGQTQYVKMTGICRSLGGTGYREELRQESRT